MCPLTAAPSAATTCFFLTSTGALNLLSSCFGQTSTQTTAPALPNLIPVRGRLLCDRDRQHGWYVSFAYECYFHCHQPDHWIPNADCLRLCQHRGGPCKSPDRRRRDQPAQGTRSIRRPGHNAGRDDREDIQCGLAHGREVGRATGPRERQDHKWKSR
ncbi:hypothetical protein BKA80DRAFT_279075 [Phyllosticta citrichinensis]